MIVDICFTMFYHIFAIDFPNPQLLQLLQLPPDLPSNVAALSRPRSGVSSSCRSGGSSAAAATLSASGAAGSGARRWATGSVPGG